MISAKLSLIPSWDSTERLTTAAVYSLTNTIVAIVEYAKIGADITPCPGGFLVHDEQNSLPVTIPTYAENNTRGRLVLRFSKLPTDSTGSLEEKTPKIAWLGGDERRPQAGIDQDKYSYLMFSYKTVKLDLPGTVFQHPFVYTGPGGPNSAVYQIKDTFIPFDELRKRLCGTPDERREAYTRDWLTYCANIPSTSTTQKNQVKQIVPQDNGIMVALKLSFDGRHLLTRDSKGNYDAGASGKLLGQLLDPGLEATEAVANLSRFIFKRWCHVAYTASSTPK